MNNHRLTAALVRAFFDAFSTGIIDALVAEESLRREPRTVKQAMLHHYEAIAPAFDETMFYILSQANYALNEIEQALRQAAISRPTMHEMVRTACRTDANYAAMVDEYKRNFTALLSGRMPSLAEHRAQCADGGGPATVDNDTAIRLMVRTTMGAYARAAAATGRSDAPIRTASLYRLLLDAMATLFDREPTTLSGDAAEADLHRVFLEVCGSQRNLDVMMEAFQENNPL